jgi:hypothetical protein
LGVDTHECFRVDRLEFGPRLKESVVVPWTKVFCTGDPHPIARHLVGGLVNLPQDQATAPRQNDHSEEPVQKRFEQSPERTHKNFTFSPYK